MNHGTCKLCGNDTTYSTDALDFNFEINCTSCGKYSFLENLETDIDIYEDGRSKFYKVSSYIYEQNTQFSSIPKIDKQKLEEVLNMKDKKIKVKFDLMMIYLFKLDNNHINKEIYENLMLYCYIKDHSELIALYKKAISMGYISGSIAERTYPIFNQLSFDGLEYIDSLEQVNQNSKNIFVAFNFENKLKETFNNYLKTAIEKEGFNYVVVNQDNVEHNKSINDEIIVKLKSSRIVIADFTNHRNSVYFEAGYAMGMNIPIIWTCQERHEDNMSFDTRQFPHIIWKDENDLVKQVIDRIKVIL